MILKNHNLSRVAEAAVFTNRRASREGIWFTSFVSLLGHVVVLAGLSFTSPARSSGLSVDLVLVHDPAKEAPRTSDFESYANQQGSGQQNANRPAKIPLVPLVVHNEILPQSQLVAGHQTPARDPGPSEGGRTEELRSAQGPPVYATGALGALVENEVIDRDRQSLDAEIIGIESYLGALEDQHAKQPRIKRYTSIAARSSPTAAYIHHWVRRVEQVGNLNYPRSAARAKISGQLRLLVVLNPRGETVAVRVLSSSGHRVLDEAAQRIVRLAEPFGEFPAQLREEADVIEIIRTWRFVSAGAKTRLEFE